MSVYAFIFARGGSKGLPKKNIKQLGGLPLLAHSIKVAQQVDAVKKIYVSTDCKEIAHVAEEYGAQVIQRPDTLATSTTPEWQAWQHAIEYLQQRDEQFDIFLSLPTTSPLRNKQDIETCLAMLTPDTDVVITVTPSARSPYFNMITRGEDGTSQLVCKSTASRRQDVPETYDITTVAYVSRPNYILQHTHLFSGNVKSVVVAKERAVDIDDAYDFAVAEMLYRHSNKI